PDVRPGQPGGRVSIYWSIRQSDSSKQIRVARVRAQLVQNRIDLEPDQSSVASREGLFQIFKRAIGVPQRGVDQGNSIGRKVSVLSQFIQLVEHAERFGPLSRRGIGAANQQHRKRPFPTEAYRFLDFGDGLIVQRLLSVGLTKE